MPRKNISDMLHRSVAGAVLFSICHFAAAETENFDFWGLTSPTYLGDPSDDKFWESLLDGTPILSTHYENILSDAYWNDAEYASEVLNYGFINQNMSSVLLAFDAPTTIKRELDLRILDANHERSSSPVLGIQTIPVSQFQVNFEKAVNLEIQRLNGTGSLAINVAEGTALRFLDKLTVKDFSQTPALLVQVGGNTPGGGEALLQLSGASSFKTLGTAFNLESSSVLKASSSFHVEAGKVFTGNGKVIANGADVHVYLKGDLGDFGGIYQ